jgi:hypothetical protein
LQKVTVTAIETQKQRTTRASLSVPVETLNPRQNGIAHAMFVDSQTGQSLRSYSQALSIMIFTSTFR